MLEFNTVVVVSPNLGKFRQTDLDTVLLVGSIGAQQPAALRLWFVAGASVASLFWFCLLGFGARWLAPWFARPKAWQLLDGLIGLTMWLLAALLVRHALTGF